jgi:N-sulfoglucosamine sulfohydrolase
MDRRSFLKKSALAVSSFGYAAKISEASSNKIKSPDIPKRPNILFCMSDDQTWLHTSIAGDPVIKTPHFDRIAREGILFTNSFTACPSCSPSRASILTGQDFWRLEEGGLLFGRLKNKFPIYTRLLEDAGYVVGQTGKGYDPANQRFDYTWKNPCGKIWRKRLSEEPPDGIANVDYAGSFEKFMKARNKTKPFCFWFGCDEPHREYGYKSGAQSGMNPDKVNVPPFFPDSEQIRNDICDYMLEIQWFDQHLGRMLKTLEDNGELDNTIIVVTSDNGMPFPRAKATVYNYGVHMPLAIRWGKGIKKPGRVIHDFVNHIDFAPTFLQAAGLKALKEMTGRSLMNIFQSNKSGYVDPARDMTVVGLERHTWTRPDGRTYPRRAIYTKDYAYIHNYEPDRWPMGGPDFTFPDVGTFGDIDDSPTKRYMMAHQDDKKVKKLFAMSFGKLPAEELYAIDKDPPQMKNLADDPAYTEVKQRLRKQMEEYQKATGDPRARGESPWDDYPFYNGKKYLKGKYLKEMQ